MSLKVAIFEDDIDVAELLKEMLESKDFTVTNFYNLKDIGWENSDIVLGDFKNKIVSFKSVQSECSKRNIPLIAISGADTDYVPQLIKPFSIEDLHATVLETLMKHKRGGATTHTEVSPNGVFTTFFKKVS